jgi:hypothetical protein
MKVFCKECQKQPLALTCEEQEFVDAAALKTMYAQARFGG